MLKGRSLLVVLATVITGTGVFAAELDVEVGVDLFDKYIWRGQNLGNRPVIQPSATIGKNGLSLNVWGNMPVNNEDPAGRAWNFNELDYTLDYSGSVGMINYSGGFILYTYPRPVIDQPTSTEAHEIYGSIGLGTFLSPTVTVYRGTKASNGWYVNAEISHSIDLVKDTALELSASLGWADEKYNQDYWGSKTNAINDLVLTAAVPLIVGDVTIVPSISYVTLPTDRIRSLNRAQQGAGTFKGSGSDYWVAGVGAVFKF